MQLRWSCRECEYSEVTSLAALVTRLRGEGLLKRSNDKEIKDAAFLLELARTRADSFSCPECGKAGCFSASVSEDEDTWDGRKCEACGKVIPPERLEVLPGTTLCPACQSREDRGETAGALEYCPRCGTPMEVRQAKGGGVARYQMICPQCRR